MKGVTQVENLYSRKKKTFENESGRGNEKTGMEKNMLTDFFEDREELEREKL